jgi:hypothetical protein
MFQKVGYGCLCEMDKAPALYSGGSGFVSLSLDRLCSLDILYIFSQFILVGAEIVTCLPPPPTRD